MRLFHLTVLFVVDAVVADPSRCNVCIETDSASCSSKQRVDQFCTSDREYLGTTHCASAVLKFKENIRRRNGTVLFFRGCISCSSKKEACFALGGFFKMDGDTLLQCEIECCTSDNCNNQFPAPSENAITVFTPDASGPAACYTCRANDADACFSSQGAQNCSDSRSLGTTHCVSAVGTVRLRGDDGYKITFLRGCINCSDKKGACALISGALTDETFLLADCEIECCTGNLCNRQLIPTQSIPTNTGHPSMTPSVWGNHKLHAFVVAISIILQHF